MKKILRFDPLYSGMFRDNEAAYVTEFVKEFEDVVTIEMNKFAEA